MHKKLKFGLGALIVCSTFMTVIAVSPAHAVTTLMSGNQTCTAGGHVRLYGQVVDGLNDRIYLYAPSGTLKATYLDTRQISYPTTYTNTTWQITAGGKGLISGSTGSSCLPQV